MWIAAPYMGSMMFYAYAQLVVFFDHSPDVLLSYVHDYWVEGSEHAQWWVFCTHANYANSKFWGAKQDSVPYVVWVILTHIPV